MFQSYQFRQINPDTNEVARGVICSDMFQSYQFRQINPDAGLHARNFYQVALTFQSYQFRQINPDLRAVDDTITYLIEKFQSYQFRQINPDWMQEWPEKSFQREVSIVSIQADQSRQKKRLRMMEFHSSVSIVSIQADQSRRVAIEKLLKFIVICFNRINSGRSIPTLGLGTLKHVATNEVSIVSIQADQSRHC